MLSKLLPVLFLFCLSTFIPGIFPLFPLYEDVTSVDWNSDESFQNNSNFQLPHYSSVHFGRKNKRGGGICYILWLLK